MSKKNKKPTYRSLVRAGVVKPIPLLSTPEPTTKSQPRYNVGDTVKINNRMWAMACCNMIITDRVNTVTGWRYGGQFEKCKYRTSALYPESDLILVEGGLERSKEVLEGLTGEGAE